MATVVGYVGAATELQDGQRVTVDGDTGVVEPADGPEAPEEERP